MAVQKQSHILEQFLFSQFHLSHSHEHKCPAALPAEYGLQTETEESTPNKC